jgi:hypothetical protein
MTTTREHIVTRARSLSGLTADPDFPIGRDRYLDTVAPNETPFRTNEMGKMSGCALTCARGILRRFILHAILEAPYRDRRAVSDLVQIAKDAGALLPLSAPPQPGDMLIVGGGEDGGGDEHAWTALSCMANPYPDGGLLLDGLDGGQRTEDAGRHQWIVQRDHELRDGWDITATYRRRVRYVIDVMAIVGRFGR